MDHTCSQGKRFDELSKNHKATQDMVIAVKADLDEHRRIQQEQDILREAHREAQIAHDKKIDEKLDTIGKQMKSLIDLNTDVSNIKVAWKVGATVGYNLTKLILGLTVIFGAIYALKAWIKK